MAENKIFNWKALIISTIIVVILFIILFILPKFIHIEGPKIIICDGEEYYGYENALLCCQDCVDMGHNYLEFVHIRGGIFKEGSASCYCKNNNESIKIWGDD